MKTSVKLSGIVAALMLAVSGAAMSAEQVSPYVHSSDGKIVKSGYGLCYRTGFWTPALAQASGDGCNCDADILGEACVEPAPVVQKAPEKVTLSADTLFALCGAPDAEGNQQLCRSTDGLSWSPVPDARFSALIGMWEQRLTGVVASASGYHHATYESGTTTVDALIDEDFPISGFSSTVAYADSSYGTSQIYFFGGRCADDSYCGHIWAYDGERWAAISNVGIAGGAGATVSPREGALFFAYYNDDYDAESDYFIRKTYYYILGGKDASGLRNDLYYTNTLGGYWEQAAKGTPLYVSNMGFTSRAFASAYIREEPASVTGQSLSTWRWAETPYLGRVTRSGDEPVPYVYVFGGYDRNGNLLDEICRGVILRFTF